MKPDFSNRPPWRVETEFSDKKFCDKTGVPLEPIPFYWVRDADNYAVVLFTGKQYQDLAHLLAAAPEMVEALRDAARSLGTLTAALESNTCRDSDKTLAREAWLRTASALAKASGGAE